MLSTSERVEWLKSVDIFVDTPDDVLDSIAGLLHEEHVAAGETFIREGDAGDCMYIIKHGHVQVHYNETPVMCFGAGEIVGEMSVLDPQPRSASVTAKCDTHLLILGKRPFNELMAERLEIALHIISVLVRRLRHREEQLQSEVFELRVEIDRIKQAQQVAEITESEFFSDLKSKATRMRRRRQKGQAKLTAPA